MTWPSEASCGECYLEGVDTSGNLPCPRCGSSDRVWALSIPLGIEVDLANQRAYVVADLEPGKVTFVQGDDGL